MMWKFIMKLAKSAWALFKAFGEKVASVVNFILLIPVYFIGVGLTKMCAKIAGAKILPLQQKINAQTYWQEYSCKTELKEKYKRMF